jgi:hypothetical protein
LKTRYLAIHHLRTELTLSVDATASDLALAGHFEKVIDIHGYGGDVLALEMWVYQALTG